MKKLWAILEIIEILTLIISVPLFVISLIVNAICIIAGFEGTSIYEITKNVCSFILYGVAPFWALLWIFNGTHAIDLLTKEHNNE